MNTWKTTSNSNTIMNTQEQILQRLASLTDQRERLTGEVALIDGVINFWQQQLDTHKEEDTALDNIMGGNPVDTIPSVSYTYTDTPMAEEYYGG